MLPGQLIIRVRTWTELEHAVPRPVVHATIRVTVAATLEGVACDGVNAPSVAHAIFVARVPARCCLAVSGFSVRHGHEGIVLDLVVVVRDESLYEHPPCP